jgi:hypothetical protein
MTNPFGRFYAALIAVAVFFVLWAVIAAKPWSSSGTAVSDPRLSALQAREQQIQNQALSAQQTLNKRWASYRAALARHASQLSGRQQAQIAAAPAGPSVVVKVTGAQPVTTSRSSTVAAAPPSVSVPGAGNSSSVLRQPVAANGGGN